MGKEFKTNEPIKHHYIPQFILRGFLRNDGYVNYYDKEGKESELRKTNQIFFSRNLYRDERLDIPVEIEKSLGAFECEIASIFKRIIEADRSFSLTRDETERLKIFLAILTFRTIRARNFFRDQLTGKTKKMYESCLRDGETFEEMWKRNLLGLTKCRKINDITSIDDIDDVFKMFFVRDTLGMAGSYFVVCDRRGSESFVLGDCFPVPCSGQSDDDLISVVMYYFLPITPDRILILTYNGVKLISNSAHFIDKDLLKMPHTGEDTLRYSIGKIYENDVRTINEITIENSSFGYIFKEE